jgi:hypothetical protein
MHYQPIWQVYPPRQPRGAVQRYIITRYVAEKVLPQWTSGDVPYPAPRYGTHLTGSDNFGDLGQSSLESKSPVLHLPVWYWGNTVNRYLAIRVIDVECLQHRSMVEP